MPVKDLQTGSGMLFTDFAEALKALQESRYLTLSGPPASDEATLSAGRERSPVGPAEVAAVDGSILDYLAAAILGGLVGSGELASRYRDAPGRALYTGPALIYIALNIASSALALALIRAYGWAFGAGVQPGGASLRWTQVLVAGIGAMALFRASLFTVRAGDRDIAVGPASFLQVFREAADRAVDRVRAAERGKEVARLMKAVSDRSRHWSGTVSYWLSLDPDKNLDFNRRLIMVTKPPFARGQWTHVAITRAGLNTDKGGVGKLYLNGKLQGAAEPIREPFTWDLSRVAIRLGLSYVGLFGDLSVFSRALSDKKVEALFRLERGAGASHQ